VGTSSEIIIRLSRTQKEEVELDLPSLEKAEQADLRSIWLRRGSYDSNQREIRTGRTDSYRHQPEKEREGRVGSRRDQVGSGQEGRG
jgi:hypothetical protein